MDERIADLHARIEGRRLQADASNPAIRAKWKDAELRARRLLDAAVARAIGTR